jgi:hypothetical protein
LNRKWRQIFTNVFTADGRYVVCQGAPKFGGFSSV